MISTNIPGYQQITTQEPQQTIVINNETNIPDIKQETQKQEVIDDLIDMGISAGGILVTGAILQFALPAIYKTFKSGAEKNRIGHIEPATFKNKNTLLENEQKLMNETQRFKVTDSMLEELTTLNEKQKIPTSKELDNMTEQQFKELAPVTYDSFNKLAKDNDKLSGKLNKKIRNKALKDLLKQAPNASKIRQENKQNFAQTLANYNRYISSKPESEALIKNIPGHQDYKAKNLQEIKKDYPRNKTIDNNFNLVDSIISDINRGDKNYFTKQELQQLEKIDPTNFKLDRPIYTIQKEDQKNLAKLRKDLDKQVQNENKKERDWQNKQLNKESLERRDILNEYSKQLLKEDKIPFEQNRFNYVYKESPELRKIMTEQTENYKNLPEWIKYTDQLNKVDSDRKDYLFFEDNYVPENQNVPLDVQKEYFKLQDQIDNLYNQGVKMQKDINLSTQEKEELQNLKWQNIDYNDDIKTKTQELNDYKNKYQDTLDEIESKQADARTKYQGQLLNKVLDDIDKQNIDTITNLKNKISELEHEIPQLQEEVNKNENRIQEIQNQAVDDGISKDIQQKIKELQTEQSKLVTEDQKGLLNQIRKIQQENKNLNTIDKLITEQLKDNTLSDSERKAYKKLQQDLNKEREDPAYMAKTWIIDHIQKTFKNSKRNPKTKLQYSLLDNIAQVDNPRYMTTLVGYDAVPIKEKYTPKRNEIEVNPTKQQLKQIDQLNNGMDQWINRQGRKIDFNEKSIQNKIQQYDSNIQQILRNSPEVNPKYSNPNNTIWPDEVLKKFNISQDDFYKQFGNDTLSKDLKSDYIKTKLSKSKDYDNRFDLNRFFDKDGNLRNDFIRADAFVDKNINLNRADYEHFNKLRTQATELFNNINEIKDIPKSYFTTQRRKDYAKPRILKDPFDNNYYNKWFPKNNLNKDEFNKQFGNKITQDNNVQRYYPGMNDYKMSTNETDVLRQFTKDNYGFKTAKEFFNKPIEEQNKILQSIINDDIITHTRIDPEVNKLFKELSIPDKDYRIDVILNMLATLNDKYKLIDKANDLAKKNVRKVVSSIL